MAWLFQRTQFFFQEIAMVTPFDTFGENLGTAVLKNEYVFVAEVLEGTSN